ncbi:MAG TPA: 30S ribosomal protein S20 [Candidatus Ruthenibacterium merdigallinarum]|nr:30S ribosomal protein S20 [Candidatus Ruthenibacterium merdigallinarum]
MPNIKSQKDRVVQARKEAAHNKAIKSNLKTVVKKADAAISTGAADMNDKVKAAVVAIDKAAGKGVLHKNTASRKVARLAKAAHKAAH